MDAIHVEFVGLDTSSVARCGEEGRGAGSDIVQMYGEPLASKTTRRNSHR
jgi:hypothetical protein